MPSLFRSQQLAAQWCLYLFGEHQFLQPSPLIRVRLSTISLEKENYSFVAAFERMLALPLQHPLENVSKGANLVTILFEIIILLRSLYTC